MDKTPVDTRTLEEALVDTILSGATAERSFVKTAVADFRQKFEDECWEAWRIAQAFERDEKYSEYLDERRVFNEQQKSFRAVVGAYNREREKEGKTKHKFTGLPEEPPHEEHPDNCIHHGDED